MVKKVFVSPLQWTKAHDEPASPPILGARFQIQQAIVDKMLRRRGTAGGAQRLNADAAQVDLHSARELPPLQFFGGIGADDHGEALQGP